MASNVKTLMNTLKFRHLDQKKTRTAIEEYQLAEMYEYGNGTNQNLQIAFNKYLNLRHLIPIEQKDSKLMDPKNLKPIDPKLLSSVYFKLGLFYKKGYSCEKNLAIAYGYYKKSSDLKNCSATYNMAIMHLRGEGVIQDDNIAFSLLQQAGCSRFARAIDTVADLYQPRMKFIKEFVDTIQLYSNKQGNRKEINYLLGVFHEIGWMGTTDINKAKKLYHIAEEAGYYKASIQLAEIAIHEKDFKKAHEHYITAQLTISDMIDMGNTAMQFFVFSLANFHANPLNPNRKYLLAYKMYMAAIKLGCSRSYFALEKMKTREGIDENFRKALDSRAHQFQRGAYYLRLGEYQEQQDSTEANAMNAVASYEKAWKLNNKNGAIRIIEFLIRHKKPLCDSRKKINCLKISARNGHVQSQFLLGKLYTSKENKLITENPKLAYYWLVRAYKSGSLDALIFLINLFNNKFLNFNNIQVTCFRKMGEIFFTPAGKERAVESKKISEELISLDAAILAELQYLVAREHEYDRNIDRRDITKALELYHASANRGNEKAQYTLGFFHHEGIHKFPVDIAKAKFYFNKSEKQGYQPAIQAIQKLIESLSKSGKLNEINEKVKKLEDLEFEKQKQELAILQAQRQQKNDKLNYLKNQQSTLTLQLENMLKREQENIRLSERKEAIAKSLETENFYSNVSKKLDHFFMKVKLGMVKKTMPRGIKNRTQATDIVNTVIGSCAPNMLAAPITTLCHGNKHLQCYFESQRLKKIVDMLDSNTEKFSESLALRLTEVYQCDLKKVPLDKIECLSILVVDIINEGLNPDKLFNVQKKDLENHLINYITNSEEFRDKLHALQQSNLIFTQ